MKPLEEMGKFKTVVVDPPWPLPKLGWHGTQGTYYKSQLPYETMPIDTIGELPIFDCLDDDALVFLWTINRFLRDAFDVLESWGVNHKSTMVWVKPQGHQFPGGPMLNVEFCLMAVKGKPRFTEQKMFKAGNFWPNPGFSAKPEEFYDLLRRVTPAPRLDIFGRRRIAGFESWGNEAPDGSALPDHYQQVLLDV